MAAVYDIPTDAQLTAIAQDYLPELTMDNPIFDILPIEESNEYYLIWEQQDNFTGLQQPRGLNGEPARVKPTGQKTYTAEPGVYGEFSVIEERELVTRRMIGKYTGVIPTADLIMMRQDKLLSRMFSRVAQIGWSALRGTFSVPDRNGVVLHTDSFSVRTFTAAVPWGTSATSTPLADLRALKYLQRGVSVAFNSQAKIYMNSTTVNAILSNTNASDFGGRRGIGLQTLNSLDQVNTLLTMDGLPKIVEYDGGYFDDSLAYQLYIPDHVAIVVGVRPQGQKVGGYRMCINASNNDMKPGYYMKVLKNEDGRPPATIEVHCGHNGGPVIYYGSAVLVMNV